MAKKKSAQGEGLVELTIDNVVDLVAAKEIKVEDTKLSVVVVQSEPVSDEDLDAARKLVKGAKKLLAELEAQAEGEDAEEELEDEEEEEGDLEDLDEDEENEEDE